MINKKNWGLIKKYLDDRLHVDQISMGSLKLEQSYIRYLLEWADEHSFAEAPSISPTFPEYMRSEESQRMVTKSWAPLSFSP